MTPNRLILGIFVAAIAGVLIGKPIYDCMTAFFGLNPLVMLGIGVIFAAAAFTYFTRASNVLTLPVLVGFAIILIILGLMGVGS